MMQHLKLQAEGPMSKPVRWQSQGGAWNVGRRMRLVDPTRPHYTLLPRDQVLRAGWVPVLTSTGVCLVPEPLLEEIPVRND